MMIEVEAKARAKPDIEERIKRLGGEFESRETHADTYFNHPARDFADTDEALRIRVKNDVTQITYKGPKIDTETKTREEHSIRVSDPGTARAILSRLGFKETLTVRKTRRKYRLNEVTLAVDDVEDLGRFVEAEIEAGERDYEAHQRQVINILRELDCPDLIRESYLEMLLSEL